MKRFLKHYALELGYPKFLVLLLVKYCLDVSVCIFLTMYSEFTSYILFIAIFCISVFGKKVNGNKYHYCAIYVQSLTAYTITNCWKKRLVKDDLLY